MCIVHFKYEDFPMRHLENLGWRLKKHSGKFRRVWAMNEGEGPALKPGARKAEIKAWGYNTEILEMCGLHFRRIT